MAVRTGYQAAGGRESGVEEYTYIDSVSEIPGSPTIGDIVKVSTAITSGLTNFVDFDGASISAASVGDVFEWDGTNWAQKEDADIADEGDWEANKDYFEGNTVNRNGIIYRCNTDNNDSTFDLSKWDEISNPLNLVKMSMVDGDAQNLAAAVIGLYQGNSQVQSGSIRNVDTLHISHTAAAFGQNPTLPDTDNTAVNLRPYFQNKLDNNGVCKIALAVQGTADYLYVQSDTIAARSGGWTLTNLTWAEDYTITAAGQIWNMIAGNDLVFAKDIVDPRHISYIESVDELPDDVRTGQLFELIKDFPFKHFNAKLERTGEDTAADFGATNIGVIGLYLRLGLSDTDAAGPWLNLKRDDQIVLRPASGTDIVITITHGNFTVYYTNTEHYLRMLGGYSISGTIAADTEYTVYAITNTSSDHKGDVFQYDGHFYEKTYQRPQHYYIETTSDLPINPTLDDVIKIVAPDGVNVDHATAKLERTGEDTASDFGATKVGIISSQLRIGIGSGDSTTPWTSLKINDKIIAVAENGQTATYTLSAVPVYNTGGGYVSAGASESGKIVDGVDYTVYAVDVGDKQELGDMLVSDGNQWEKKYTSVRAGTGLSESDGAFNVDNPYEDADAAKVDSQTFGAIISRKFVDPVSGDENEAITSIQNTPNFGVTDFLGIDKDDDYELINAVRAGQFIDIRLGTKRLIAEVAGVDTPVDTAVRRIWYKTPIYSTGLDSYGDIGTGDGTIQFSIDRPRPEKWEDKAYASGRRVTNRGDTWIANQDVPVHEPPPGVSPKWDRVTATRIASDSINISEVLQLEFNNLSAATGEYTNLVWQQGALDPDIILVNETSGIGSAKLASTMRFITKGQISAQFTPTFTGSSNSNWTLTLQYTVDGGTNWNVYDAVLETYLTSGDTYGAYFTRNSDLDVTIANAASVQWRLRVQTPAGIILTSYNFSFDAAASPSTPWVRFTATLSGGNYQVAVNRDGDVKRIDTSDASEQLINAQPVTYGTALPTSRYLKNQAFQLTADATGQEVFTNRLGRRGDDTNSFVDISGQHFRVHLSNTGTLRIGMQNAAQATPFTNLVSGDKIYFVKRHTDGDVSETSEVITITLSVSPTLTSHSPIPYIELTSSQYSISPTGATIENGVRYFMYAVPNPASVTRTKDSVFINDGRFWAQIIQGRPQYTWVGNRRYIKQAIDTVNTTGGLASLMTNSITPSRAGALIRITVEVFGSLTSAPANYGYILFYARMKKGSGSYGGIHGSTNADGSYIEGHIDIQNYSDACQTSAQKTFLIEAADTDTLTVNVYGRPRQGNNAQTSMRFNRNTNENFDEEVVSYLELAEYKPSEDANPITLTEITAVDAA